MLKTPVLTALIGTLALAACQGTPQPSAVSAADAQANAITPVAAATSTPTPEPTATPTPTPTPGRSIAPLVFASETPTPAPTPTPGPSGSPLPLGEANHGSASFPTAPMGDGLDLSHAVASATGGDATARGAIDGNLYTEWSARQGAGDKLALVLDLQAPQSFSKLDLLPDASPAVTCFFNVEVSTDGTSWTTVAAGSAAGSNTSPQWGTASFPTQTARYVRVKPTSWGTSWAAVWELRLRR